MRRLALIAALLGVALVAAACTSGDSSGSSGSSSTGEPVSITLWHGYGKVESPNGQVNHEALSLQDQIDAFNAAHPDIHVEDVFCCSNDNALEKLTVRIAGRPTARHHLSVRHVDGADRDRAWRDGPRAAHAGRGV